MDALPMSPLSPDPAPLLVVAGDGFSGWHSLNDTIMGGRSQGQCSVSSEGLVLEAPLQANEGVTLIDRAQPAHTLLARYNAATASLQPLQRAPKRNRRSRAAGWRPWR